MLEISIETLGGSMLIDSVGRGGNGIEKVESSPRIRPSP